MPFDAMRKRRPDWVPAGIFTLVAGLSATLAALTGGSYFITRALQCLRGRVLHMDLPIALGITAAFSGSIIGWALRVESLIYFDFVAVFTFLMLAGRKPQSPEHALRILASFEPGESVAAAIMRQRKREALTIRVPSAPTD